MASGFVSGGTSDAPIERSDEWLAAQLELEAGIVKKQEATRQAATGRSLFETLEANKAAKQEAFEEANRLKNQFRALDADEAEFLDSVLESTRVEQERVKRETAEGLQLFRQQQEEVDKKTRGESSGTAVEEGSPTAAEEESWVASGRKRRRAKEKEVLKGVKIRRSSTIEKGEQEVSSPAKEPKNLLSEASKLIAQPPEVKSSSKAESLAPVDIKKLPASSKVSLVNYGSDDEDNW